MLRFVLATIAVAIALIVPTQAQAGIPCSTGICVTSITATNHVRHFTPKGHPGEAWVLYLNLYEGKERLSYQLLPGSCDASYASPKVSASLHACGRNSRLDYVSWDKARKIRVEYRYVRR